MAQTIPDLSALFSLSNILPRTQNPSQQPFTTNHTLNKIAIAGYNQERLCTNSIASLAAELSGRSAMCPVRRPAQMENSNTPSVNHCISLVIFNDSLPKASTQI